MVKLRTMVLTALVMGLSWFPSVWAGLNDGLVAYYPFNGNANDESGNGNDGTIKGATPTTDRFGNVDSAYSFDKKSSNSISVPDHPTLKPEQLTVSAWVEPSSMAVWNTAVMKGNWNGYGILYLTATDVGFYVNAYGSNRVLGKIELNQWSHLVGVSDGSTIRMYINGELVGTTPGVKITHTTNPLTFGAALNNYFWDGKIDDVRIYNRALSEDEVKALYSYTDGGHTVEVGPGQQIKNIDFGNAPIHLGGISGTKWKDLNGDGKRQEGEPGLAGVTIYLDSNRNGELDEGEPRQVTDENGHYKFSNLDAGIYVVREVVPDGYEQTFPN